MSLPIPALPIEVDRLRRFTLEDVPNVLRLSADPSVHDAADELGSNETEAARALVDHAFTQLHVTLVHAEIEPEHRPSRAVIEHLAFTDVTGTIETCSPTALAYSITASAWAS